MSKNKPGLYCSQCFRGCPGEPVASCYKNDDDGSNPMKVNPIY